MKKPSKISFCRKYRVGVLLGWAAVVWFALGSTAEKKAKNKDKKIDAAAQEGADFLDVKYTVKPPPVLFPGSELKSPPQETPESEDGEGGGVTVYPCVPRRPDTPSSVDTTRDQESPKLPDPCPVLRKERPSGGSLQEGMDQWRRESFYEKPYYGPHYVQEHQHYGPLYVMGGLVDFPQGWEDLDLTFAVWQDQGLVFVSLESEAEDLFSEEGWLILRPH